MTARTLLSAALVAIAFAMWPLIGRQAKVSGPWMATFVMSGSALLIAALSASQLTTWPSGRALWILAGAAAANGVAVYMYASSVANPAVPTGPFIVVVSVLQVAAVPFLVWVLPDGQAPTLRQAAGFAFAAVAVYLLARS
jgi:hypothetical protein